jgi:(R,R)-butanediol dehydrogenase/meso-butanediol dehydrogenase/diacetyl reductase
VATFSAPVTLQPTMLVITEKTILSSCAYLGEDFRAVIDGIADGSYSTDGWVETIPLDDIVEGGFEALHEQRAMKILVDVRA